MIALGLDIGTTTICGAAVDSSDGRVLKSVTLKNAFAPSERSWEKLQNPADIMLSVISIAEKMSAEFEISCIGVSGQMHGILYVDKNGEAVSPLYTWQDERGALAYKEGSYADYTGTKSGYGLATHFYNLKNGLIDSRAVTFCTIGDFAAMNLAGNTKPILHQSNAASLGMYNLKERSFDYAAAEKLGMPAELFPKIGEGIIGSRNKAPVACAIGDNQASFIGSVRDMKRSILVNVGTGSQVSVYTEDAANHDGFELRPCVYDGMLMVGAPLCGGRAYAMLKDFYLEVLKMAGITFCVDMYEKMAEALDKCAAPELHVITTFCGTRSEPEKKGAILNISTENFTPYNLTLGMLNGIAQELYIMYEKMQKPRTELVASGNGVRNNRILQQILEQKFGIRLHIPKHNEEAAYGAALYALTESGVFSKLDEAQRYIRYEEE